MIEAAGEFVRLCESDDRSEQLRAGHEEAPLPVWLEIITRYAEYRFDVAYNKTVPLEILAVLVDDPDDRVRSMVARKRKLTPELIERMAADSDSGGRMSVARHRRTARHVLEALAANDSWDMVRENAAERLAVIDAAAGSVAGDTA